MTGAYEENRLSDEVSEQLRIDRGASLLEGRKLGMQIGLIAPEPPASLLKPQPKSVPELLRAAAQTFEDRNKVYGSNYKMVGPMVKILFPNGVPSALVASDRWHLFELMLVKISRFAISGLNHQDSIHDTTVYAAMVESLLKEGEQ